MFFLSLSHFIEQVRYHFSFFVFLALFDLAVRKKRFNESGDTSNLPDNFPFFVFLTLYLAISKNHFNLSLHFSGPTGCLFSSQSNFYQVLVNSPWFFYFPVPWLIEEDFITTYLSFKGSLFIHFYHVFEALMLQKQVSKSCFISIDLGSCSQLLQLASAC